MRTRLALLGLVAGLAAALPAAPASAYCDPVTSAVTGGCSNPCTVVNAALHRVSDQIKTGPCFA
jgi:hypothetical protein